MVVPKPVKMIRRKKFERLRAVPNHREAIYQKGTIRRSLRSADWRYKNNEQAEGHARNVSDLLAFKLMGEHLSNSKMRTLNHYTEIHTLLDSLSRGHLKGKKILHLAASTGVYAHYLQERCGANAIALDIDHGALLDARSHGVKKAIQASAVPLIGKKIEWVKKPNGLYLPEHPTSHLPFKDNSLNYVISDHFLFADFHKNYRTPGFETQPGSIRKSEEALEDLYRVLRPNGRVIIGAMHSEGLPSLRYYQKGFKIHGFVVEETYGPELISATVRGVEFMILRKERNPAFVKK